MQEQTGSEGSPERFELGKRYEEVGPDLGRLYEAWNASTGNPALVLHPGDRVEWKPSGVWRVVLSCQVEPVAVTLEVERAPAEGRTTELADALVMMTAAVQRVEDNTQAHAHLEPERGGQTRPYGPRVRRAWRALGGRALSGVAGLVLGLGVRLCVAGELEHPLHATARQTSTSGIPREAPEYTGPETPAGLAYPMPDKPFRSQALPPCTGSSAFVAINGGCWVELAQKPPCDTVKGAEYQDKCYMPIKKDEPVPRAAKP